MYSAGGGMTLQSDLCTEDPYCELRDEGYHTLGCERRRARAEEGSSEAEFDDEYCSDPSLVPDKINPDTDIEGEVCVYVCVRACVRACACPCLYSPFAL